MVSVPGPSCRPSVTGCEPPSVLRPGCCCYICKRYFLLIFRRAFCPLEGGGGQTRWLQAYSFYVSVD